MDCLVSVIIPVYNVERYLKECVDSVISQTYRYLEIILVDDGSSDASGTICDEYRERDNRVKVIHKKNGGLSDARNTAIEMCTGEYVVFIDSDDYVSPCFVEVLLRGVESDEINIAALSGGVDFWDGAEETPYLENDPNRAKFEVVSAKEALEQMLYQKIATGAPFKIYKKTVFDEIRFPVGYYYEDVATTYKTFEKTKKVSIIECPIYAYRKRKDSIIRQAFSSKKLSALNIYEELINDKVLREWGLEKAAVSRAFAMMYSVFLQVPYRDRTTRRRIWEKIKKCRKTVAFNNSKLMRRKNKYAAIVAYFGMDMSYFVGKKVGQKGSMN